MFVCSLLFAGVFKCRVRCSLLVVGCVVLFGVVCCWLCTMRCLLFVACCLLIGDRWWLFAVACWLLAVGYMLLFLDKCSLCDVRCLLFVVV